MPGCRILTIFIFTSQTQNIFSIDHYLVSKLEEVKLEDPLFIKINRIMEGELNIN
jgi:hypothetical protein